MPNRIPLVSGDEYDALTKARRFYRFRPGQRRAIKGRYQRRLRRALDRETARVACEGESA